MTADKLIKWSAVAVVVAVAAIAAAVSYNHALALVEAHGETGTVARLVPLTADGLIYTSSIALLSSARQQRPAPPLAYGLLALGIGATLAANVAHGLAHGPAGAAVAAWPALSLVGSYELLMMIIRAAGRGGPPRANGGSDRADSEPPTLAGYDAAVAAYRASVATGRAMSARQLAARHDISRRQAGQIVSAVAREADSANQADLIRERTDSATGN